MRPPALHLPWARLRAQRQARLRRAWRLPEQARGPEQVQQRVPERVPERLVRSCHKRKLPMRAVRRQAMNVSFQVVLFVERWEGQANARPDQKYTTEGKMSP